jgi:hypoxanthine phosphoribosyltransferase
VRVTRYRNSIQGSATLDWIIKPSIALRGARVLLMDDIFDEGKTLEALDQWIREQGASEVYSAVMINKLHTRKPAVFKPHFSAADAPDEYVFGMGMDYQGAWRNANGIWYLAP